MKTPLITVLLLALTGCTLPAAQAENTPPSSQSTRIILQQDGERKEWQFAGNDWKNSNEWQEFLAQLEPERRDRLEQLLNRADFPPIPPMPPMPPMPKVLWQNMDGGKHLIIRRGDGDMQTEHIIDIQQKISEQKFAVIQRMLQQTELNRDQLQALQQLLDSKH